MWPEINISVTAASMKSDKKYISRISKHSGSDVFTEFIEKYIMKVLQGVKSIVHCTDLCISVTAGWYTRYNTVFQVFHITFFSKPWNRRFTPK